MVHDDRSWEYFKQANSDEGHDIDDSIRDEVRAFVDAGEYTIDMERTWHIEIMLKLAEQIFDEIRPGSGHPKAAWIPRAGLVMQTIQRPEGDNPDTVETLDKLIAGTLRGAKQNGSPEGERRYEPGPARLNRCDVQNSAPHRIR